MASGDELERLRELSRATEALRPSADFAGALMRELGALERRTGDPLATAAADTEALRPSDDFADAVMTAIARERSEADERAPESPHTMRRPRRDDRAMRRMGAAALAFATVAAAASVMWSVVEQRELDSVVLDGFDPVEIYP